MIRQDKFSHAVLRPVWRGVRKTLLRGWETNHDVTNAVFLAGCGRSGTTWLSEIINADRSFRYMFEPFNSMKTAEWREFAYRQYLPRYIRNERALAAATAILSGQVHNEWVDCQNRVLLASRRLVKDIRANLLLGWLKQNFPTMRLVVLIRHPLAVTVSRVRLGWEPALSLDCIRAQPALIEDFLRPHMAKLERWAADPFALQIANWCIENLVALSQLKEGEYCLVTFEALVSNPEVELDRVFKYLGMSLTCRHRQRLGVPSAMASYQTWEEGNRRRLLRPWENRVSASQLETMETVVTEFGMMALLDRCTAYQ